jgi:PAS domain S-box-containing protein
MNTNGTESPTPDMPGGSSADFLAGGGEMGALMRAHDWQRSTLGPPRSWPQSLRTAVRLLLNTGHPMYVFWGPEGACLYNDAYSASIGPERHPGSLGRPAHAVWDEIWPIIGPQIEHVMSGQGATWHENHLVPITRHGRREEVYWTYSYSPIDDESAPGGIGGVLVVCSETTAQVLATRRLAAERDQLAQMFAQAPTFMALLRGPEHRIEIANPLYLQLVGHRPVLGRTVAEALPDAVAQGYLVLLDRAYQSGRPCSRIGARFLVQAEPGGPSDERFVDFVLQPIQDKDGGVSGIFVVGVDVTDRTRADAALRESEASFRAALRAGHMGSWSTDFVTGTRSWSDEGMALFGLDLPNGQGRVGGDADEYVAAIHPDDRQRVDGFRALARHQDSFPAEYRIVRPDGTELWLSGHGMVLSRDAEGRPLRLISIMADNTERKRAEQDLREADRKKDTFIAMLAHELRNPLAPIRNAIRLLRRSVTADQAEARWSLDVIDRQAVQMSHLLDDLLDVARMSRAQLRLRRQHLALSTIIEQAVEIAQPLIEAAGHDFHASLPAEALTVDGDLTRLAQVFSNLLINAAKYTPAGGRLSLHARRDGDGLVVAVADNGIGIAAEHLDHVFEIFGQVDSALERSQGGQGIGLSLVKGLVDMHGGRVSVHSDGPGQGSTFTVWLPLHSATVATTPADRERDGSLPAVHHPQPVPLGQIPPTPMRPLRVLIADDSHDIADSLALLLQACGHEAQVAYDGEQALQRAERWQPDVVLLDLGMPRLSGYEVCRRLRTTPWGRRATLVAQTGWGQASDRQRTVDVGFDHHLVKPFELEDLLDLLPAAGSRPRDA